MSEPQTTALEHARAQWHEANTRIGAASGHGNPPDPHRYAALLDARAGWWDHLGHLADRATGGDVRDVYAIACSYAAILDRQDAARVRFRYRIPTLHPSSVAQLVGLNDNRCETCGRPWLLDPAGACPACPALYYGITPGNAAEAANYPPGQPWTPEPTLGQEDVSTASHERPRGEPLTETEWTGLRELAWHPVYEPPAGTPERGRHDALRLALGEAERLAGRARNSLIVTEELAEILTRHHIIARIDGPGQAPRLYTDLMEWVALTVERETYRLRGQDVDALPDKIPARVKTDAPAAEDGRVQFRKRDIPERLDWLSGNLAAHFAQAAFLPRNTVSILEATVASIGAAAADLRAQATEQEQQQRDHAETVELLGRLVDDEDTPCRSDSYGYCTEHHSSQPCDVPEARALLARIRGEQPGGEA